MRAHRNSNTEMLEQKGTHQLNDERSDLRQPGMGGEVFSIRHYIETLSRNAANTILKTPYEV